MTVSEFFASIFVQSSRDSIERCKNSQTTIFAFGNYKHIFFLQKCEGEGGMVCVYTENMNVGEDEREDFKCRVDNKSKLGSKDREKGRVNMYCFCSVSNKSGMEYV